MGTLTLQSSRPGPARPGPTLWSSFGPLSWGCAAVWPLLTVTSSSGTVQIPSKPRDSLWQPGRLVGNAFPRGNCPGHPLA